MSDSEPDWHQGFMKRHVLKRQTSSRSARADVDEEQALIHSAFHVPLKKRKTSTQKFCVGNAHATYLKDVHEGADLIRLSTCIRTSDNKDGLDDSEDEHADAADSVEMDYDEHLCSDAEDYEDNCNTDEEGEKADAEAERAEAEEKDTEEEEEEEEEEDSEENSEEEEEDEDDEEDVDEEALEAWASAQREAGLTAEFSARFRHVFLREFLRQRQLPEAADDEIESMSTEAGSEGEEVHAGSEDVLDEEEATRLLR